MRSSLWDHVIAQPGNYQENIWQSLAKKNLEYIMESGSGASSPMESEAMELGYKPYSEHFLEALASDKVPLLIEIL